MISDVVDAGLAYFAGLQVGSISTTISKIGLGHGDASWDESDSGLSDIYTSGGLGIASATIEFISPGTIHAYHTFTNTSGTEQKITECGLFDSGGTPGLLARHVFSDNELKNAGYVPNGESITIHWYIYLSEYNWSFSVMGNGAPNPDVTVSMTVDVNVGSSCLGQIFPIDFNPIYPLCFNGYEIPGGSIDDVSAHRGAYSWEISGKCETLDQIEPLLRLSGPVSTGDSITGKRYVLSVFASGVFSVKSAFATYIQHEHCYITDFSIEPFGDGYLFDFRIHQSAYEDA